MRFPGVRPSEQRMKTLTFAHSPDPDDAYMFYGFAEGAVTIPGYDIQHHLEDIQTLNERALRGNLRSRPSARTATRT